MKEMGAMSQRKLLTCEGRTLEVRWRNEPHDALWDGFVASARDGHHEQTSLWGQVRARYGWKIARFTISEQGNIIAGAQAQVRPIGPFGYGAYITYGPCIETEEKSVVQLCLEELKLFLKGLGVSYAVVGLPYYAWGLVEPMEAIGFVRKPIKLPPHFLEATAVIDLTKQPDEILANMRPSTRRNLRHAMKKDITVREGDERHLDTFRELMCALCVRRKIKPNPSQADFFQELWKIFHPKGWIKLFVAMYGEEPVSAAIAFSFRDWFRVWKVGWSGQYGSIKPNEGLWWEMIQYARRTGHRHFDFVDIDLDQAGAVLERKGSGSVSESVTSFKLGFGGAIRTLPGAYCYFSNPLVRAAMQRWGVRILNMNLAKRLIQRFTAP
jgi:peptidoglycan pentaglycine glycine transferase (the first glycine)